MSLRGCLRGVKYSVFLLNFVAWITGMAMLVCGIYMRMDVHFNHMMSAAYVDKMFLFHRMCYILIGSGALITFVGFLGCCSAFQESSCMLGTFFTFLVLLISAEVLAGVWSFLYIDEARIPVPPAFAEYAKNTYGKNTRRDEHVDHVQQLLQCCGGFGSSDWAHSAWSNRSSAAAGSRHQARHFVVPESCCFARSSETVSSAMSAPDSSTPVPQCLARHRAVFDGACGRKLVEWLDGRIFTAIISSLGLVGIQLCSLCLSLALCCGLRKQSAGGYKT